MLPFHTLQSYHDFASIGYQEHDSKDNRNRYNVYTYTLVDIHEP